ncbi:MAG: CoA transferase, partial [Pseudonocardia sp.]|nr:CoA transferase [Pseudonocardia sp.]
MTDTGSARVVDDEPGVLTGIRVVELATWAFVPAAGVVLADWGAEVVKIERPGTGDPIRGLVASGMLPTASHSTNFMLETTSRGKRGIALDLSTPDGRDVLLRLVETADVFLTNYLPGVRCKLGIDVEDLRGVNPRLIYVRGSGLGPRGPEADAGGYDGATFWARAGVGQVTSPPGGGLPLPLPGPGYGDVQAGAHLAGGVAAALLDRERTGRARVVDVSLLAAGLWTMGPHVSAADLHGTGEIAAPVHETAPNPLSASYVTGDGRAVVLVMLESDRFWGPLTEALGRPELATDPRFADAASRMAHSRACVAELDATFGAMTIEEAAQRLSRQRGVWARFTSPGEASHDRQAEVNGYVADLATADGGTLRVVTAPAQFDETAPRPVRAPGHGEHTDALLAELGVGPDEVRRLRRPGRSG